jgi:tyrosinase
MRYPSSIDSDALSQNKQVAANMDKNSGIFRSRLYNLFTNYPDYSTFSNEAWIPQGSASGFDSIESIHDQVHGFTGGGGHMSYIDYSAFDPLFMLHHAMVDRCFAIWQAINPTSYVEPKPSQFATYTVLAGSTADMYTPLEPFYNPSGAFWDSSTVRATETFGYVYPETANNGTGADRAAAVTAVNKLYGQDSSGSANAHMGSKRDPVVRNPKNVIEYREWIANILVRKHALSGPFFIHIFLGAIDSDPHKWSLEPSLVGSHCIFDKIDSNVTTSFCNCTADIVTGTIPLTSALSTILKTGALSNLDVEAIEPFLTRNLRFKVSYLNYTEVPASKVPSLKINVVTATVQKAASNGILPIWGAMADSTEVREG